MKVNDVKIVNISSNFLIFNNSSQMFKNRTYVCVIFFTQNSGVEGVGGGGET
jgi:hypothetical protein